MTELRYCVMSAGCPGPSRLSDTGHGMVNGDLWTCDHCESYVVTRAGLIPQAPVGPASPVRPELQPLIAKIRQQLGGGDHVTATPEELVQFISGIVDLTLAEVDRQAPPVRDPAPPTCDHCKGPMELIWACYHKHPVVYRLARSAGIELGVRDPSPPEVQRFADWLKATFPRGILWAELGPYSAAQMILAGVRGAGVVPPEAT